MLDIEISMDCRNCANHCCGFMPHCRPVLMPWEPPSQFFGLADKKGKINVIRKRRGGYCIFLNEQCQCAIYPHRPLECRLFPFKLKFTDYNVKLEVDQRCAQHHLFGQESANRLLTALAGYKFPMSWIWSYVSYRK